MNSDQVFNPYFQPLTETQSVTVPTRLSLNFTYLSCLCPKCASCQAVFEAFLNKGGSHGETLKLKSIAGSSLLIDGDDIAQEGDACQNSDSSKNNFLFDPAATSLGLHLLIADTYTSCTSERY